MNQQSIPRRNMLLAGAAVGALAVPQEASADTAFTTFPFKATGGTVPRTLPDRLNDEVNVKEWGAGRGGDDGPLIQAAIDYAMHTFGGGTVKIPPGNYNIGAPGLQNNIGPGIRLIGSGRHCTNLYGNFHGFIIDQNVDAQVPSQVGPFTNVKGTGGFECVAHMNIRNGMASTGASCTSGVVSGDQVIVGGTVTGAFALGQSVYNPSTGKLLGDIKLAGTPLASITWSSGTATATTRIPHGLSGTPNVSIYWCAGGYGYNGRATVTSSTTFTYPMADPGAANHTASPPGNYNAGNNFQTWGNPTGVDVSGALSAIGFDQTLGAVRWNANEMGLMYECNVGGWTGLSAAAGAFNTTVINCSFNGGQSRGTVGAFIGNVTMINCTALGWWVGIAMMNVNAGLYECRTESNDTGVICGFAPTGVGDSVTGFSILGHTTERCNTAMNVNVASCGMLAGHVYTGTIGVGYWFVSSIVGDGTKVTVTTNPANPAQTLDMLGWGNGSTRQVYIEDFYPGVYTTYPNTVTATRTSPTTFTYPSTVTGPRGPQSNFSFKQQSGLQVGIANTTTFKAIQAALADPEQACINLNPGYSGGYDGNYVTFEAVSAGGANRWRMPVSGAKCRYLFNGCDQPTGSTLDASGVAAGMRWGDLPGQGGVFFATAKEDMEYTIIDGQTAAIGAVVSGGGGGGHYKVRYVAGAGWIRIG